MKQAIEFKTLSYIKGSANNTLSIMLYIIDQCNFSCWYCYNDKPRTQQMLDLNKTYLFLKNIVLQYNRPIRLTLIGGEPTLHPDLYEFCKKVCTLKNVHINVFSNFSNNVILYKRLLTLSENINITFSYHIQYKDVFLKKFFNLLNLLHDKKYTQQIYISIVVESGQHFNNIIGVFNTAINFIPYKNIDLLQLDLQYANTEYTYTAEEWQKLIKCLNKIYNVKKQNEVYEITYSDQSTELVIADQLDFGKYKEITTEWICNAGIDEFYCHSDGNIYRCQYAYMYKWNAIGNIYNDAFKLLTTPTKCSIDACASYSTYRYKAIKN